MSIWAGFLIFVSLIAQLVGLTLLPMTRGLTQAIPTIAGAVCFLVGLGIMARVTAAGVNLSLLIPILAAATPIGGIVIGIIVYGEPASALRIATLLSACVLIGASNFF